MICNVSKMLIFIYIYNVCYIGPLESFLAKVTAFIGEIPITITTSNNNNNIINNSNTNSDNDNVGDTTTINNTTMSKQSSYDNTNTTTNNSNSNVNRFDTISLSPTNNVHNKTTTNIDKLQSNATTTTNTTTIITISNTTNNNTTNNILATDILCPMYARISECIQLLYNMNNNKSYDNKKRPLILCEYAHMMGNSGIYIYIFIIYTVYICIFIRLLYVVLLNIHV